MSILTRNKSCNILYIITLSLALIGCKTTPTSYPEPDIPISKFHSADLALRLGRTIESDLISRSGNIANRYSHIGIIIESDSGLIVVDIEPSTDKLLEKIKAQKVEKFFASEFALAGAVMRYNGLQDSQINRLTTKAIEYLNSSITFDHDYCFSDPSQMYCTELIERLFQEVEITLSEGRNHQLPLAKEPVILPSDISQNENLELIWHYDLRASDLSKR